MLLRSGHTMSSAINVEVVVAVPESQLLISLSLPAGSTVADAVAASGALESYSEHVDEHSPVGIWGREVARDRKLAEGDRVEIYRELLLDPMEARRLRASAPVPGPSGSRSPRHPRK